MISTDKRTSALLVIGLLAAALALAGCTSLPFMPQAAQPGPGPASVPATSTPADASSTTPSIDATEKAAIDASLTAVTPLGDQVDVPDVTGMDAKDAQEALKEARLDYVLKWSGDSMASSRRVVSQQPPAGSTVTSGSRITILAATGKGEGRRFPVLYYGTTSDRVFGIRCSGTVTTVEFPVPEGTYIVCATTQMPLEVWVIDDYGHRTLLQKNYKSNGVWKWTGKGAIKVTRDGNDDRDFRDYRLYIKTSQSRWWDVRYGFLTSVGGSLAEDDGSTP